MWVIRNVRRFLMTDLVFGRTDAELRTKLASRDEDALRARGVIVGTGSEVREQLAVLAEAGAAHIMLKWLDLDDLDGLEALAKAVLT